MTSEEYQILFNELITLRDFIIKQADLKLQQFVDKETASSRKQNLAHYLALRTQNLQDLQIRLAHSSLSSLAHSETHVLENIQGVLELLATLLNQQVTLYPAPLEQAAQAMIEKNSQQLFGGDNRRRQTRIMVTLPSQAAWDSDLIHELLRRGVDCFRINCAHDSAEHWLKMCELIRQTGEQQQQDYKILFDLAGHKLRTLQVENENPVIHIKTEKDAWGRTLTPAKVIFHSQETPIDSLTASNQAQLLLPAEIYHQLQEGDQLVFKDARNKKRSFIIERRNTENSWLGVCAQNTYLTPGLKITYQPRSAQNQADLKSQFLLPPFREQNAFIKVYPGDQLLLSRTHTACHNVQFDDQGQVSHPAIIAITMPLVIEQLTEGESVWIDDGKVGCIIEQINEEGAWLRVEVAVRNGVKIKADKGVNFPDTRLNLPSLSEKDRRDLQQIAPHADLIALSFVQAPEDLICLQQELAKYGKGDLPIIAKIETKEGVKNLGEILLSLIDQHPIGVMIARGDLAIELGSVKMAEIQEDILWLCAAGQVPVIWATQVLENLTKTGTISRPEVSDAAMSVRAECVMLNKGDHLPEAVRVLETLLTNMQNRQQKKLHYLGRWSL